MSAELCLFGYAFIWPQIYLVTNFFGHKLLWPHVSLATHFFGFRAFMFQWLNTSLTAIGEILQTITHLFG